MADLAEIGLSVNTRQIVSAIRELDRLATGGDQVQRSFDRFGNELRQADRTLGRFIDAAGRMREANGRLVTGLQRVTEETENLNENTRESVPLFRAAASALAAYISVAAGTETIVRFEDAMLGLQAVTRASTSDMAALEKQARELGATSVFSAEEAANAQRFLAQGGLEVNDILGSTGGILNLAAAGGLELADAADIATNVLGGMRLEVSELARVNDVLAETASASNTDISQMGEALSTVAPLAASAGISIEETSAALGILASNALQGSRGGTGLLGVIRQLSNVTPQAEEALSSYGLTLSDVDITSNGLTNVLDKLRKANIDVADSFTIFGSEAAPAADILSNGADEVEKLTDRIKKAESPAKNMADILGSGLSASFRSFNSQVSESVIQLGKSGLAESLQSTVEGVTGLLAVYNGMTEEFAEANDLTKDQVASLETMADVLEITTVAAIGAGTAYAAYTLAVNRAAIAQATFNTVLRANPIAATITVAGGLAGAMLALKDNTDAAADAAERLSKGVEKLNKQQQEAARNIIEEEQKNIQAEILKLIEQQTKEKEKFKKLGELGGGRDDPFREKSLIDEEMFKEDINRVDVFSDKIEELRNRYSELNKALTTDKGTIIAPTVAAFSGNESTLGIKGYTDEIQRLVKAYGTTTPAVDTLKAAQSKLLDLIDVASKDKIPELEDALSNVNAEIKKLSGTEIDWEAIGTTGADSIASTLASGDWSGVGDAIGGALSNGIGTALSTSLGGGIAGGLAGGLAAGAISSALSGKKKTGSSTSVSVSGGSTSGSTRTNYSGLFGSSSSIEALTSDTLSALDNSVSDSLLTIGNTFSSMGLAVTTGISDFATTVKVGEGEFSDAIEEITDDYIDANFAAIEDYARAGETFVETFERINEEMVSVIDSFSVGTGSGSFQAAADAYIETQGAIIDASTQSALSSARQGAIEAKAAFDAISPTGSRSRTNSITGRTNDRTVFTDAEQGLRRNLKDQIDSYNNIIAEQTSRLGIGVQTASVNFSNAVLGTIASIEGISSEDAITRLGQLTTAYESSYFTVIEQLERSIDSAAGSLSQFNDLGATTGTSLDEFQEAFERFRTSDAFTPEGYSRYLLAADALAEYQSATESLTEQIKLDAEEQKEAAEEAAKAAGILLEGSDDLKNAFDNINDFVNDLIGLGADGELSLAAASSAYQQTLALAATGNEDALSDLTKDAQNYLDAVTSSATTGSQVDIAQSKVVADLSNLTGTIPAFAAGGSHTGGLRLVGENGPEIEMTGPSNIISNAKSSSMLDNTELTRQVAELKQVMESGMFAVAKNTNKSYKVLQKFDTQGLPQERVV